jgi:hypothetical protein
MTKSMRKVLTVLVYQVFSLPVVMQDEINKRA